MFQTGYKGIVPLPSGQPFCGGICKWYYTPRENINGFPMIDPLTQYLSGEPSTINTWFGPIRVPNNQLGFEEVLTRDKIGLYYKQKVSGFYPGDSLSGRINLENMPYHEYLVVGKMRAGGLYLLVGSMQRGMHWDADYKSGAGILNAAGTEFSFSLNALNKALILPSFNDANTIGDDDGSDDGGGGGDEGASPNDVEIIYYTNETSLTIDWTPSRIARFGIYPLLEIWYTEVGNGTGEPKLQLNTTPIITVDAAPPYTTQFFIAINAPGPGYVVIK